MYKLSSHAFSRQLEIDRWVLCPSPTSAFFTDPSQYLKHRDALLLISLGGKATCNACCQFCKGHCALRCELAHHMPTLKLGKVGFEPWLSARLRARSPSEHVHHGHCLTGVVPALFLDLASRGCGLNKGGMMWQRRADVGSEGWTLSVAAWVILNKSSCP